MNLYLNIRYGSNEALLEGIEAGRVKHLLLDLCRVGTPSHEEEFLFFRLFVGALALMPVFEVEQPVPTVLRATCHDVPQKGLVTLITGAYKE